MDESLHVTLNSRVNLDDLFARSCERSLVELVTPFKMAIYLLFRLVDILHEASLPSGEIHAKTASLLYGLLEKEPLTFQELCAAISSLEVDFPGILKMYIKRLVMFRAIWFTECLSLIFRINLHMDHYAMHMPWEHLLQKRPNGISFLTTKSVLSQFIQRLSAADRALTHSARCRLHSEFRAFVKGEQIKSSVAVEHVIRLREKSAFNKRHLPLFISTGARCRLWLQIQLHLLQVSPTEVCPSLEEYCHKINAVFPDNSAVHLVLTLLAISRRDLHTASKELHCFFDYSVMRGNDSQPTNGQPRGARLVYVDQRHIKYAPVLHARLHRIFGDKAVARRLLAEAVAAAQSGRHQTCLRFALLELAAVEATPDSPSFNGGGSSCQLCAVQRPVSSRQPQTLLSMASEVAASCLTSSFLQSLLARTEDDRDARMEADERRELSADPLEQRLLVHRLIETGRLVSAITSLSMSTQSPCDYAFASEAVLRASSVSTGPDPWGKARQLCDAATVVRSAARLSTGLTSAARTSARALLISQLPDNYASTHDTFTQAVAGVTIVYSYAMECNWQKAREELQPLKKRFCRASAHWKCSQTVKLAESLVDFDCFFLSGEWSSAEESLPFLQAALPHEALLRSSALLAARSRLPEALELLLSASACSHALWPAYLAVRLNMMLGVMLARVGKAPQALPLLQKAESLCRRNLNRRREAQVTRRKASVLMSLGEFDEAYDSLMSCSNEMEMSGGPLERCLLHLSISECIPNLSFSHDSFSHDNNCVLYHLGEARDQARRCRCVMLEKAALAAAANILQSGDQYTSAAIQLMELTRISEKNLDWTVL